MIPTLLLFDVNETLLDLSPMRSSFSEHFGSAESMGEWFARLLHGSLVANHLDAYRSFGAIGMEALTALAARRGVELSSEAAASIAGQIRSLPAHGDVENGLTTLAAMGFRLATLTNGDSATLAAQLEFAGIAHHFDSQLSVDSTGRFKPHPATYEDACRGLDVDPAAVMMVASHDWDIAGALAVGLQGAFIARRGSVWSLPQLPPPPPVADLSELAAALDAGTVD